MHRENSFQYASTLEYPYPFSLLSITGLKRSKACGFGLTEKSSLGSSKAWIVAVVAATCPPADPPPAMIIFGSTPNFAAFPRIQRTADFAVTDAGLWLSLMFTFRPIVSSKSNHSTGCQVVRMPGKLGVRSAIPSAPKEKDHRRAFIRLFPIIRIIGMQKKFSLWGILVLKNFIGAYIFPCK